LRRPAERHSDLGAIHRRLRGREDLAVVSTQ
jgi:hypothetical protein